MNDEEISQEREILTRKADLVRSRLEATLEQLDHKRHEVMALHAPLEAIAHPPLKAILAGVATLAAGVGFAIYRIARRPARLRRERSRALQRLWQHPERAFRGGGQPSVWQELGRRLLLGGASFLATQLLKHALDLTLPAGQQSPAAAPSPSPST